MRVDIENTENHYGLILADPPWQQQKGQGKKRHTGHAGEPLDYPTLSLDEIKEHLAKATALTEQNRTEQGGAILFLWTIDKYLFEAQKIAEELGWKLHARLIWNKVNGIPAAFTVRYGHEYLLYMYRGKLLPVAQEERGKIHTVFTEKVHRHSQKPEISYEIINRLYPDLKKLELYARYEHEGFDIWGNEAPGEIETENTEKELEDRQNEILHCA